MIWEYADKIFKIEEVLCWYVIYVAKYRHPKWKTTKWKECTRRRSLCWVIDYILKEVRWNNIEKDDEYKILMWWVCAESRDKYLKDIYKK